MSYRKKGMHNLHMHSMHILPMPMPMASSRHVCIRACAQPADGSLTVVRAKVAALVAGKLEAEAVKLDFERLAELMTVRREYTVHSTVLHATRAS